MPNQIILSPIELSQPGPTEAKLGRTMFNRVELGQCRVKFSSVGPKWDRDRLVKFGKVDGSFG